MSDYKTANALAAEALQLWGQGQLEAAADRYARAIAEVPSYPDWRGAYAGVLQQMGRHDEATLQYETALRLTLAQAGSEAEPGLKVARHFLADHLTRQGLADQALAVLAPAVEALPNDWLIATTHAQALFALGRRIEARAAAERALTNARSEAKRRELQALLQAVIAPTQPPA